MKKYSVLIADDNAYWCNELAKHIDEMGLFEVLQPAYNGGDALAAIQIYRPDIVILDLIMPVYDGLYIINYIRREMSDYQPFIYILSAIGTERTDEIMCNLNADYYSIKPIKTAAVAENLFSLMNSQDLFHKKSEITHRSIARAEFSSINLHKQVEDYLYMLGAQLYRISTSCLHQALYFALEDNNILNCTMKLYKRVSEHPDIKPDNAGAVERNLRTAIKTIQETSNVYFNSCFPEQKIKLTNTVFLNKSVYIVKLRIEDFLSDQISVSKNGVLYSMR